METLITGVKEKQLNPPRGKNLVFQRLHLEDAIIRRTVLGQPLNVGDPSDPEWCAYANYLAALLDANIRSDASEELRALAPWVAALASGIPVPGYPYCTDLRVLFSFPSLDPTHNALALINTCRNTVTPPPNTSTQPSQIDAVTAHFDGHRPGAELRLRTIVAPRKTGAQPQPLTLLDDGCYQTALRLPLDKSEPPKAYLLCEAADELWIRWLRDSLIGLPPRSIECNGKILPAGKLLPQLIDAVALPDSEQVVAVFRAVMMELWPPQAAGWLVKAPRLRGADQLIRKVLSGAKGSAGFERLSEVTAHLL